MCDLGRLLLYGAADEIVEGLGDLLVGDCAFFFYVVLYILSSLISTVILILYIRNSQNIMVFAENIMD